jgi:ADP-heptose:LPS heptosyltransferase
MFARKSENILVVKTGSLSAFVAAEPLFEVIRRSNPRAKISLLTSPSLQRLARASPYFDQVAAPPDFKVLEAKQAFIRQLKNAHFARVLDLAADEESAKLKAAIGPFGPKWHAVDPPQKKKLKKGGEIETAHDVSRFLSETGLAAPKREPDLRWALSARKDSANMQPGWFGISGLFGLLLPSPDPDKRWPAGNYADLARIMARARIMPVMAGGKELHGFGDEIANDAPEIVDLCGKTDHLQLTALAQEAAFFVTDCSEEAHLTISVGCSGVVIRRASDQSLRPEGRHVVTLTAKDQLGEASAEFVWRTLSNMGLIERKTPRAAAR